MSREGFMERLGTLLSDVPEEERQEALSYYRSYFDDAGEENEERILRELESPEKVAATIKADLGMDAAGNGGEYTERGFSDGRFQDRQEVAVQTDASGEPGWQESRRSEQGSRSDGYDWQESRRQAQGSRADGYGWQEGGRQAQGSRADGYDWQEGGRQTQGGRSDSYDWQESGRQAQGSRADGYGWQESGRQAQGSRSDGYGWQEGGRSEQGSRSDGYGWQEGGRQAQGGRSFYGENRTLKIVLLVAVLIVTSPAWMGLLGGLVGVAAAAIGVLVAAACIAVAFYLAGFVLFGVGIGQMAVGNVAAGFMLLGVGLLLLAFAILLTMAFLWVVRKGIPWICNAIGRIWRGIFSRRERAA